MKKSIALGLVTLSLVACGTKEEVVAPAAPAAEVAAPAAAEPGQLADAPAPAEAPAAPEAAK